MSKAPKNKIIFFTITWLILFFLTAGSATAYLETGSDRLIVNVSPPAPGPLEQFTVTVKSFYYDLNKNSVVWTLNNQIVQRGTGKTDLLFRAGNLGKMVNIDIAVAAGNSQTLATKTIRFVPGKLDILAEPLVYVPPFYFGRGAPTAGSEVKLLAETSFLGPNQKPIPETEISYEWQIGNVKPDRISGLGKNIVTIPMDISAKTTKISVTASAGGGLMTTKKDLILESRPIKINLYEVKPLRGIVYHQTIQEGETITTDRDEFTVIAEPFFAPLSGLTDLKYRWVIANNQTEVVSENSKVLTILNHEDNQTEARISLTVSNFLKVPREIKKLFTILFASSL